MYISESTVNSTITRKRKPAYINTIITDGDSVCSPKHTCKVLAWGHQSVYANSISLHSNAYYMILYDNII